MSPAEQDQPSLESKLQQIAAEMAMLSPGSDDGLIPLFAISGEILDSPELDEYWIRAMEALQTLLDIYLDEGRPVDDPGMVKFQSFNEWLNEAILKSATNAELPPLPNESQSETSPDRAPASTSTVDAPFEAELRRITQELAVLKVGSDEGLIPLYSLSSEILDSEGLPDAIIRGMENLQGMLNTFLDEGRPMDDAALGSFLQFREWLSGAITHYHEGNAISPFQADEQSAADPAQLASPEASAPMNDGPAPITSAVVAPDEEILVIDTSDDTSLLQEYFQEAMEHLDSIEGHLLTLESNPKDAEGLAAVFRAFHSVKGVAGFLQLKPIQRLAHQVESLLDLARNDEIVLNSQLITLILQSCDSVKEMTNLVGLALEKGSVPDTHFPIAALVQELEKTTEATLNGTLDANAKAPALATKATITDEASAAPATVKAKSRTTRVASERINNLMDVVGELVILESQLMQSAKEFIGGNTLLQRQFSQLQRILKDLQHTSMALQMVPIKPTFQRVERIVRDLSQKLEKQIDLRISGEDTELDRTVVELITDPLVHMIRNAADHGLESTAEREAAGKNPVGQIELKAYHMGSTIVVELSDDGGGIDPQKIRAKAVEKGLISPDAVLTKEETLQLIFAPGFSTAAVLTEQSGRGVGMDVVKRNIESMRGVVSVESVIGKGSNFKIKLPLTTAIIDGLIVRVGGDKYIIPTHTVQVTLRPKAKQITRIANQREMLIMSDCTVPIVRLNNYLGIPNGEEDPTNATLAVVESVGKQYALMVDEMINKQEVVIKPLGDVVGKLQGIAGGAILGDGSIALILDPAALVKQDVA